MGPVNVKTTVGTKSKRQGLSIRNKRSDMYTIEHMRVSRVLGSDQNHSKTKFNIPLSL